MKTQTKTTMEYKADMFQCLLLLERCYFFVVLTVPFLSLDEVLSQLNPSVLNEVLFIPIGGICLKPDLWTFKTRRRHTYSTRMLVIVIRAL